MSDEDFVKALRTGIIIWLLVMVGMNLFGCTTSSDGWHQDEIDWVIKNV